MDERDFELRKLTYESLQTRQNHAFQLQGDYGKWLVASLLLIHGAAFAFLAQDAALSKSILPFVYWPLVIGLLSALLCGLTAWINWTLLASMYDVSAFMVTDNEFWPKFDGKEAWWVTFTFWAALIAGMISAVMILIAAIIGHKCMLPGT